MKKPEIKTVAAILSNPSPSEPAGRITIGRYILEDGLITMVDADGNTKQWAASE